MYSSSNIGHMKAFQDKLAGCAQQMEQALDGLLNRHSSRTVPDRLLEAMRHACLGGGKRFRPFLVLESAGLFGIAPEDALPAAIALELVHCYSLVHDDLPAMDDDTLRRGRPTVHVAFGEATAILAGDTLLTLAFEMLGRSDTHPDPAVRSELVLRLAEAAGGGGMAGGQMLDLAAEGNALALPDVERMQAMKTGALITFGCEAGAILGGAPQAGRAALRTYGRSLGIAFQISDDLLDAEGKTEAIGKTAGKDARARKATFVSLLGFEGARQQLARSIADGQAALQPFGPRAQILSDAIRWMGERRS